MAITRYKIGSTFLDYTRFDIALHRGVAPQEIVITQSADAYSYLEKEVTRSKGIVDLTVECSRGPGKSAGKRSIKVKGLRVIDLVKRTDLRCTLHLTDARVELVKWICKYDLNVLFRDGYLPGTRQENFKAAVEFLLQDEWSLFANDPFKNVTKDPSLPDDLLYAGATLGAPLDDLLSKFGVDLWCDKNGKLRFASREDIDKNPLKNAYHWFLGKEPGWLNGGRVTFRKPKKLIYYYKKKHAILAHIIHDRSTVTTGTLSVQLLQVYSDGDDFMTLRELLQKYAPSLVGKVDDQLIGDNFMKSNFEDTVLERDGSADRDRLIKIIKSDWRRLFEVYFPDSMMGVGGFDDLQIGVFKRLSTVTEKQQRNGLRVGDVTGDVNPSGGIRGVWTEFLNVISGTGPKSIEGKSGVTVHDKVGGVLPSAPYAAKWEQEAAGIIRLSQDKLPDDNYAILAKNTNAGEMKVTWVPARTAKGPGGKKVATRWGLDVPPRSQAKLQPKEAVAILVGTQRLPNNADRWHKIELDGFSDGDVEVQEFEVSETAAIFDYVDPQGLTGVAKSAIDQAANVGQFLNQDMITADAEARRESFIERMTRPFEGEGIACGNEAFDKEEINGAIDSITLQVDGVVIGTAIDCAHLANDEARENRARRRAAARRARAAGKQVEAV